MKRTCWKCSLEKELKEFYRNRSKKYGREHVCIICSRELDRIRERSPKRIQKSKLYQRSKRGKKTRSIWLKNDYWKNKHKYTAKKMVAAMVEAGELKRKPCEKCGKEKVVAHHPDYAKPLEIVWLCKRHHSEVHRK